MTSHMYRVTNRLIKLKEMYLDANEGAFALATLPLLRSPEEWAALKPLKTMALRKRSKVRQCEFAVALLLPPTYVHCTLARGSPFLCASGLRCANVNLQWHYCWRYIPTSINLRYKL